MGHHWPSMKAGIVSQGGKLARVEDFTWDVIRQV
jgi:hypothetical protein